MNAILRWGMMTAALTGTSAFAQGVFLPTLPAGQSWALQWGDEFNGNAVDGSKWIVPSEQRNSGRWDPAFVSVHNGVAAFRTAFVGGVITSAGLVSRLSTTGGYFVARVRFPSQPGFRPAFWLSASTINNVDDPRHPTELDVFELPGRDGRLYHNIHWNGYGAAHQTTGIVAPAPIDFRGFHQIGLWWTPTQYRFYLDGRLTWTSAGGGISTMPEFMKIGNEILPDNSRATKADPATLARDTGFLVDYVRVYRINGAPGR